MGGVTRQFFIGNKVVDDSTAPYCLAEIGNNHGGNLETCKLLIRAAADAGFDCVKLQRRTLEKLYTRAFLDQSYSSENSYGATYGEHRAALEFDREQYRELIDYTRSLGMHFACTAFDEWAADFLAELGIDAIKIASGDIHSTPLLMHVAGIGLPVIVSTGTANAGDVDRAVEVMSDCVSPERFCVLQCTAEYACPAEHLNLRVVETYRNRYPATVIGLSTHYNGPQAPSWAFILGARVFEMHVTLDRAGKGTDHKFSLEPHGQKSMVRDLRRVAVALGDGVKRQFPEEAGAITKMGKSITAACDLSAGTRLEPHHLAFKTPGGHIPPWRYPDLLGMVLSRDVKADEPIAYNMVA